MNRTSSGHALVPGTGYLELARALWIDLVSPGKADRPLVWNGGFESDVVTGFSHFDWTIASNPYARVSIDALLAPIVGGAGTLFGSLFGALAIKTLGEATKLLTGEAPGLDLVVYGVLLIAVVGFRPRGMAGLMAALVPRRFRKTLPAEREHA